MTTPAPIPHRKEFVNEDPAARRTRARKILSKLRKVFPTLNVPLHYSNPFQLLVATILSAQCTDQRVNMVTPGLFERYRTVADFAASDQRELEEIIKSTGFFRMKAKNIIACSKALVERFAGTVPGHLEDLVSLPGVGRKTANVVLNHAFGVNEGIVVDTHVHRLSRRLGLTEKDDPVKIELELMELLPRSDWGDVSLLLIFHGRATCVARKPRCEACAVHALCPSSLVD